jgi:hypothetical protein
MTEGGTSENSRVYPIKKAAEVYSVQKGYTEKLQANLTAADKAIASGQFTPFAGIDAKRYADLFEIKLELTQESQEAIRTRVTTPLKRIAEKYGIPAIFAGEIDQEPHVILDVGRFTNIPPEQKAEIIRAMQATKPTSEGGKVSHLAWTADILKGVSFDLDTLVIGAPNSYICASVVDEKQGAAYKARKIFNKAIRKFQPDRSGFDEDSAPKIGPHYATGYYNILHVSVAKLTGLATPEKLTAFRDEAYASIGRELKKQPIPITVENVYLGTSVGWAREHSPHLFTENFKAK